MSAHEALPPDEHREVCERFFRIVAMEVRPIPHNALASMMHRGNLHPDSATRLLACLWRTPPKVTAD